MVVTGVRLEVSNPLQTLKQKKKKKKKVKGPMIFLP